jgi:hypothetical protein
MLLAARHLVTELTKDAQQKLRLPAAPQSVFTFTARLSTGTVAFADTAAAGHPELAHAELFVEQVATDPCGLRSG